MMKVVKDISGNIVAYGPDDGSYDPVVNEGCTLTLVDDANFIAPKTVPSKEELLANIIVTISTGKQFNGDDLSINRMAAALTIASYTGQTSTGWKLADNTTQSITIAELKEALALSMTQVGKIIGAIA